MTNTTHTPPPELARTLADLPPHMQHSAREYWRIGQPPGGFMAAVLRNDLQAAAMQADPTNARTLDSWARYLHRLPRDAWGSRDAVAAWIARGGAQGVGR